MKKYENYLIDKTAKIRPLFFLYWVIGYPFLMHKIPVESGWTDVFLWGSLIVNSFGAYVMILANKRDKEIKAS